jgi:hypothetical protein
MFFEDASEKRLREIGRIRMRIAPPANVGIKGEPIAVAEFFQSGGSLHGIVWPSRPNHAPLGGAENGRSPERRFSGTLGHNTGYTYQLVPCKWNFETKQKSPVTFAGICCGTQYMKTSILIISGLWRKFQRSDQISKFWDHFIGGCKMSSN